jgi:hypothetical protein
LLNLSVGVGDRDFLGLQFIKKSFVILLSLMEDVLKFTVSGLKLSGFLLKLLKGSKTFIEQFVESFALVFALGSLVLELFQLNRIKCTVTVRFLFSSA